MLSGDIYMILAAAAGSQHLAGIAHPSQSPPTPPLSLPPDWSSRSSSGRGRVALVGRCSWLRTTVPRTALSSESVTVIKREAGGSRSWQCLCIETLASAVVFGRRYEEPQITWIWGSGIYLGELNPNMSA